MNNLKYKQSIFEILNNFKGIEPLKELFWSELNYDRVNESLSRRNWPKTATEVLAEDPVLFASGGQGDEFHIIYSRLSSDRLFITHERPVVSKLLNDHPYSLFIFSNEAQDKWHFINVKYDEKTEKRRLFRRITIGHGERLRTAIERIEMLNLDRAEKDLFGQSPLSIQQVHDNAFNVEAVTKQFFDEYRIVFKNLQNNLESQSKDKVWAHDYALQFLNRVMFLYFIQRKGWLGGDSEFLRSFWKSYQKTELPEDTFFEQWLSVLFFEAFNNKFHGGHRHFPKEIKRALATAPYLNGGLFQKNDLDQKPAKITDARFEQIFAFMERYNFTISEDSPLDKEVAVDPEMIGKVYESLVNVSDEVDERGDAGIFYTPRTEIDLMCRLSLVDNLTNYVGKKYKDLIYEVVFAFEPDEKTLADKALAKANLWKEFNDSLGKITVLDPACGSGSFLVGMLYVLDDLQDRAAKQLKSTETPYDRKKRIIRESLYGVDVMAWACHVAELRLWLALIIDAEIPAADLHIRKEPLLPHFSFKIRCGDSLVQEVGGINLGHIQSSHDISPQLKKRLTKLKTEKFKFYNNDPSCQFSSTDEAMHEELQIFRDILGTLQHNIEQEIKRIQRAQEMLIGKKYIQPDFEGFSDPKPYQAKLDLKSSDKQKEIKILQQDMECIKQARSALKDVKDVPFVWDIAFVETFGAEISGFDIVIGNPPYVRQENIADPRFSNEEVTTSNKKEYKAKLARSIYQIFPRFFEYNASRDTAANKIGAKSDLYIYFYLHGLSLLNPKGTFCFITSNSWLDVGYGKSLQEFLLKHCHIKMVIDNQAKRSFASADVNTIIVLFSSPNMKKETRLEETARFVMFKEPFEHILSPVIFEEIEAAKKRKTTPEYRVNPIGQKLLLEDGCEIHDDKDSKKDNRKGRKNIPKTAPLIKIAKYIGNKWGGKYLRAPDIYWTILKKGKDKLVRLGDVAEVRFGIKTGANDFFFLDKSRSKELDIEKEFLMPVIKSPRESKHLRIVQKNLKYNIIMCHKNKHELKGTKILEHIKWGEEKGYHKRPSCSSRKNWWDLGQWAFAQLLWVEIMFASFRVYINSDRIYESDKFYGIISHKPTKELCLALNSSILLLWKLLSGFSSLGQGALKTPVYEVKNFLIPSNTEILTQFNESMLNRSIENIDIEVSQADRKELDSVIFDYLKLTQDEGEAVYEAIINLYEARLNKAKSLNPMR
ncbi:MAG: Eco57I restriction-modification methylase domain-containing protein [Deltaproteobacteria bacterium]|nr:Eco57I restriction-modification methylase domain-containing protein [Deltaproteobacteria bacterium]